MREKIPLEKILEEHTIVYKRVPMAMPHCNICKQMLTGNNSSMSPYRCLCGEWELDWSAYPNVHRYRIKTNPL